MKSPPILSLLTGLAALIGLANCEVKTEQNEFSIDVAKGQRVKLKPSPDLKTDAVSQFEKLLLGIAPDNRKGTWVNLKRDDGREEEGPTADNTFTPAASRIGPDGSMHNTQNVRLRDQGDFKKVVDSLDTGTPTPIPGP